MNLEVGYRTDRGLNPDRPINEDSFLVEVDSDFKGVDFVIAAVADGMGGMDRGDDASRAAVDYLRTCRPSDEVVQSGSPDKLADWLKDCVFGANSSVRAALGTAQGGCTLTAIAILDGVAVLAHVGDSRAYLRSGSSVVRISNDHSLVALLVASGEMTEEEAELSDERNAILRSLGSHDMLPTTWTDDLSSRGTLRNEDDVPVRNFRICPGEAIVLVSDGVWGVVPSEEFSSLVLANNSAQELAERLVDASLQHGAPDNTTAVVIGRPAGQNQLPPDRKFFTPTVMTNSPPAARHGLTVFHQPKSDDPIQAEIDRIAASGKSFGPPAEHHLPHFPRHSGRRLTPKVTAAIGVAIALFLGASAWAVISRKANSDSTSTEDTSTTATKVKAESLAPSASVDPPTTESPSLSEWVTVEAKFSSVKIALENWPDSRRFTCDSTPPESPQDSGPACSENMTNTVKKVFRMVDNGLKIWIVTGDPLPSTVPPTPVSTSLPKSTTRTTAARKAITPKKPRIGNPTGATPDSGSDLPTETTGAAAPITQQSTAHSAAPEPTKASSEPTPSQTTSAPTPPLPGDTTPSLG